MAKRNKIAGRSAGKKFRWSQSAAASDLTLGALLLVPGLAIAKTLQNDADLSAEDDIETDAAVDANESVDWVDGLVDAETDSTDAHDDVTDESDDSDAESDTSRNDASNNQEQNNKDKDSKGDAGAAEQAEGSSTESPKEDDDDEAGAVLGGSGIDLSTGLLLGAAFVGGIALAGDDDDKDRTPPTATITLSDTALKVGETATVTISFSEPVSGLTLGAFSVENGTLSNLASSDGGKTWTATFTPASNIEDATNLISLAPGSFRDVAGNGNVTAASSPNYAIDTKAPTATITLSDRELTAGETTTVTITFSEAVTGLTASDFTIENGTLGELTTTDGGLTWTATFTPSANLADPTNVITLNANAVTDAAGNANTAASSANFTIDTTPPTSYEGRVVDGYVAGATVFYDADGDFILDPGEVFTVTDENGNFVLEGYEETPQGQIVVAEGGIDTETGNTVGLLASKLNESGVGVVTPLTLLLTLNPDLDPIEVMDALGVDIVGPSGEVIDLTTFDPLAAMDEGDENAAALGEQIFAAQQKLFTIIQAASTAAAGSGQVDLASVVTAVQAVADALREGATNFNEVADMAVAKVVTDPAKAEAIASVVKATNDRIDEAYLGTDGGLSLSEARRILNSGEEDADTAAAIARLAAAKAAGSASQQTVLETIVAVVASANVDAAAVAANFQNTLNSTIADKTNAFTTVLNAAQGDNAGLIDGLPAYLVSQVRAADAGEDKVVLDLANNVARLTLKDLIDLNVKSVVLVGSGSRVELALGESADLDSLDEELFADDAAGTDYQITLRVTQEQLLQIIENVAALEAAGIDFIKAVAGTLTISAADALDLIEAGLTFSSGSVVLTNPEDVSLEDLATLLIDGGLKLAASLEVSVPEGETLGVSDALALVAAGVSFAAGTEVEVLRGDLTGAPAVYLARLQDLLEAGVTSFIWPEGVEVRGDSLSVAAREALSEAGVDFFEFAEIGPPTVNTIITNDVTPLIAGTIGAPLSPGEVLTVTINGATYVVVPRGTNWTLDTGTAVPSSGTLGPFVSGETYSVTATVTAADGTAVSDETTSEVTVDTDAPTVAIALSTTSLKAGETATVTITFSEAVKGFSLEDLVANNGTLSQLSQPVVNDDGSVTYTAVLTPKAGANEGAAVVSLRNGYTDLAGNVGPAAVSPSISLDTQAPTALITLSDTALKVGETATVTITFSEAVTGLALTDLEVANGTLTGLTQSTTNPLVWTATFTPTANIEDATNVITLKAGGVADAAGNANAAIASNNYTIDTLAPAAKITLSDAALKVGETATVTITFSEAVTGLALTDFEVANGTLTGLTQSTTNPLVWTATFTPTANIEDATNVITLKAGGVADAAGNANAAASSANYAIDTQAPAAPVITKVGQGFTVTEGAAVTVVVDGTTQTSAQIADKFTVTTSGGVTTYAAKAGAFTGSEDIDLSATITDAAGNVSPVGQLLNQAFDSTAPTAPVLALGTGVSNGATAAEARASGGVVTVTGEAGSTLTVTFTQGSATVTKTVTATGSAQPVVLTAADVTALGQGTVSVSAVATDAAGNASTAGSSSFTLDTVAPTATITLSDSALTIGETATVTITFSEAVTGLALTDFEVANGTLTGLTQSTTNPLVWTATFTPTANIEDATNVITLKAEGVVDAAGNANAATSSANYAIDTQAPTATITLSDTTVKNGSTATVTITFSEAVSGFSLNDLIAPNATLSNLSGPTTNPDGSVTYTATYTAATDDQSETNDVVLLRSDFFDDAGNRGFSTTSIFDQLVLDSSEVAALANATGDFAFTAGSDVIINGTGFLNQSTPQSLAGLLGDADVDVRLTNISAITSSGANADATLDALIDRLGAAGVDRVELDADQITALAGTSADFDVGVDVIINGTGFLSQSTPQSLAGLLGDADVSVRFSTSDINGIVALGSNGNAADTAFDALVDGLMAAGVDKLELDAGQVASLAGVGVTVDAGVDVIVNGTGFLGGGANSAAIFGMLGDADVDVRLTGTDLDRILAGSDANFDALLAGLQDVGMDRLLLDAGQVAALATSLDLNNLGFSLASDLDVLVTGTAFLGVPGVTAAGLAGLFGSANVDVALAGSDLQKILGANDEQAALDALLTSIDNNGSSVADSLYLDVGAVQALAGAGLDLGDASVTVEGTGFLTQGTPQSLAGLLGDTDLTVRFDSANIASLIEGGDAAITQLEALAAGLDVDTLEFTAGDLAALAEAAALSASIFDSGFSGSDFVSSDFVSSDTLVVDVVGTGFLSGTNDNREAGVTELFGDITAGIVLDNDIVKLLGNP